MIEKAEEFFIFIGAILIGVPLGLFIGIICWFKFPLQVYVQARTQLALKRIEKAKAAIKEMEEQDQDIWEKHINRMQEKKSYDN